MRMLQNGHKYAQTLKTWKPAKPLEFYSPVSCITEALTIKSMVDCPITHAEYERQREREVMNDVVMSQSLSV